MRTKRIKSIDRQNDAIRKVIAALQAAQKEAEAK